MSNSIDIHLTKDGRDSSLREELALCRRAMESGEYDNLSDKAWVALCEHIAIEARDESGHRNNL